MQSETDLEKDLVGKQGGSKPLLTLESDDCYKDYEVLKGLGVNFIDKPEQQPWGIAVSFKDLYGNLIYLCQSSVN
jgi:hypothetical protein